MAKKPDPGSTETLTIKLKTALAGTNFSASPGQTVDRPANEAIRLVDRGSAEPVGWKVGDMAKKFPGALAASTERSAPTERAVIHEADETADAE